MRRIGTTVVALALCGFATQAQRSTPMSLREMVKKAGTIIHGLVTDTRSGKDPVTGQICTWVTLDVKEDFYGGGSESVTFKVLGGSSDGLVYRLADMPRFRANEEVVLLMYPPHRSTGFSSPIGMGQGKFVVRGSKGGKRAEQVAPSALMKSSPGPSEHSGSVPLSVLADDLRRIVAEVKGVPRQ